MNAFEKMRYIVFDILRNKYADFNGRASREEFWNWHIATVVVLFLLSRANYPVVGLLGLLALIVPNFAVMVRRFHDIGKSGWWALLMASSGLFNIILMLSNIPNHFKIISFFIGLICFIVFLIFMCRKSESGRNKYGANPKEMQGECS